MVLDRLTTYMYQLHISVHQHWAIPVYIRPPLLMTCQNLSYSVFFQACQHHTPIFFQVTILPYGLGITNMGEGVLFRGHTALDFQDHFYNIAVGIRRKILVIRGKKSEVVNMGVRYKLEWPITACIDAS
jgi:hypothetical protein